MNVLTSVLVLTATCLVVVIGLELRPSPVIPSGPAARSGSIAAPAVAVSPQAPDAAPFVDTLLARPLFSQTRRPANTSSPVSTATAAAPSLPRMTGILIDGSRRSAIFAGPDGNPAGKPSIVMEGDQIGPFTVQTIEPQQVIVVGPQGKRTVRTSFDPTLQPPPPPAAQILPAFPGIAIPGAPSQLNPTMTPSPGYGQPRPAGAAR